MFATEILVNFASQSSTSSPGRPVKRAREPNMDGTVAIKGAAGAFGGRGLFATTCGTPLATFLVWADIMDVLESVWQGLFFLKKEKN